MIPWWEAWQLAGKSLGWETVTISLPSLGFLPGLQYQDKRMIGLSIDMAPSQATWAILWEEWGRPVVVWQDQWLDRPVVVENKLRHLMGQSHRIPARLCRFETISPEAYRDFLEQNHLFGSARAAYRYGLFLPESYRRLVPAPVWNQPGPLLVAVSGFSKPQTWERSYGPSKSMEWIRFASLSNFHVVGGWQKILRHVELVHQPDDIMSYTDRGWQGQAQSLAVLGFQLDALLPPMRFSWDLIRNRRVLDAEGDIFNTGTEKWIKYFHPF